MTPPFTNDDDRHRQEQNGLPAEHMFGGTLRRQAKGFTLLEVLLVIAIMVAVLAVALPVMRGSFDNQRLRKAGETIQTEWARARNKAIRTGQVHVFQHALYSDQYVTTLQTSLESSLLNSTASTANQANSPLASSQLNTSSGKYEKLPEGVFFMGADVRMDNRTSFEMTSFESAPIVQDYSVAAASQEATGEINWGMPVFFFPDGTTSSASLMLANDRQKSLTISLRGLTGITRVGTVQTVDQLGAARSATQ